MLYIYYVPDDVNVQHSKLTLKVQKKTIFDLRLIKELKDQEFSFLTVNKRCVMNGTLISEEVVDDLASKKQPFCCFKNISVSSPDPLPGYKIIVLWTKILGRHDPRLFLGTKLFQNCDVKTCQTTFNKVEIIKSDAVIFHVYHLCDLNDMPQYRFGSQRWVAFMTEAPPHDKLRHGKSNFSIFNNIFNWSMTYRLDSHIPIPFGATFKRERVLSLNALTQDTIPTKTRLVAWFVSHCHTPAKRESFVEELQHYIKVDIVGRCGKIKCPYLGNECYAWLEKHYKFYLALENSVCKDYVTEKFFNVLDYNVVPIVLGGANYSDIAPPNSYIDARKFQSVEELAKFLLLVDKYDDLYNSYFEWKKTHRVERYGAGGHGWCELCAALHDRKLPANTIKDFHGWWYKESRCENLD
ncbi:alpha-(1,3)-fucosyltransferase C-like [Limulus polyphemus]|uniref:Fucosyltransferase n=1 Tax=Limulus polyphemus TaxID=6850 RepID=A0ABM1B5Y3_LIMPO|nr:alpha-(1,3)-fucosyltransferase C-like [Limulus polyphemus]